MVKRPMVSVVVVTHDAERHIVRTIDSVLNQSFSSVQLVIADCASRDRTASICQRVSERDIRLDVLVFDEPDRSMAFDRAVDAARGRYVLVLGQEDWLAPGALEQLDRAVHAHDLQLALPALSIDEDAASGERSSRRLSFEVPPTDSAEAFRSQAHLFVGEGVFSMVRGKLFDADRLRALGLRMSLLGGDVAFLAAYLEEVERVGVVDAALYHLPQRAISRAFSMVAYERCECDHRRFLELIDAWHRGHDEQLVLAVHRLHLRELIACIEGVCASRGISTIERNDRVRDMLRAPSTRATVSVLGDESREFGFIFGPIARGNVVACCLSARLSALVPISHLHLAARGSLVPICA